MENPEVIVRPRPDIALVQKQQLGSRHGQNLVIRQNHNVDLVQTIKHETALGENGNRGVGLEHDHALFLDHEIAVMPHSHNHGNGDATEFDDSNQHENEYDDGDVGCEDVDPGIHQDRFTDPDSRLVLSDQNHEIGLSDDHGSAGVENDELVVHRNPDMGVVPLSFQGPQLVLTSPVIQSRTCVPSPNYELMVGQEFPDVASCRRALRHTAIALHFEIQTVKSDKTRFTAKCASEGCPWRIHAAKLPGVPTFTIRTIHAEHNCGGIAHLGHQQASVDWVASSMERRLKENPQCKPKEILEEIHRVHGITLSYKQAWRGKERIMSALRGSFEEDYRLLPQYCDQVRRTNPGSIASVYVNPADNSFQRLFISFQASISGFLNACRPLLGLDRTVLKSKYHGTLLFATGFDGDGALFPLAFGVVDEENEENWMWFLSELRNLLEVNTENMPRLTILSDRQKSIVDGVEVNFPTAFHGFCMHYLSESFRNEFNNTMLVNILWDAANALTVMEFESKFLEIEDISQEAAYWIRRYPARLWATAYFEGTRFGHLTANIVESLNAWVLEASGLPIIQMMECIRRQLMMWFNERRETSMQWTSILVPTAERCVSEAIDRARNYQVLRADEAEFEVISHEGTNIVDIRNRRCLCRGWQLYGLPCAHAVAALLSCRQNVHRFTESCFTVANYRKAYCQTIHPIPDKTLWKDISDGGSQGEGNSSVTEIIINPPKSIRPAGRPRKRRVRSEDHVTGKRIVHCSRCNQIGHFRTTCSAPI